MLTVSQIRKDLKEIRYYYSRKTSFDGALKIVGSNGILDKVHKYNEAVRYAPPKLYDIYVGLYINGSTQEGFSVELNYTPEYIQMLNKQLILFLQKKLKEGKNHVEE